MKEAKKWMLLAGVTVVVLLMIAWLAGCSMHAITPQNPFGITDINDANAVITAAEAIGGAAVSTGIAFGNHLIATIGIVITALAGIAGTAIGVRKRKE